MRSSEFLITAPAMAALAAVLSLSVAAVAQSATTDEQAVERANAAIIERYMTDVQTELTGNIDTKNAAVGQEVDARTRDAATLADGTALPRGTKLVGHVIQVKAESKDQPVAMLAITFDRAQLKDGASVALRSEIRTVGPPANFAPKPFAAPGPVTNRVPMGGGVPITGGIPASDGPMGGGMGGGQTDPMGGGQAGGGGSGGTRGGGGGLGDGQGGLGGSLPGQTTRTIGQRTGITPDVVSAEPSGTMPVAMEGETTSTAPRATSLRGVMLSNSAGARVSGVLIASGQNISLNSGTQITLGVIANQPRPAQ